MKQKTKLLLHKQTMFSALIGKMATGSLHFTIHSLLQVCDDMSPESCRFEIMDQKLPTARAQHAALQVDEDFAKSNCGY